MKNKILIVEKNEIIRYSILHVLKREGYDTISVSDGKSALDLLNTKKFDILIINILLQYYSGFEIISLIRSREDLQHTKIVVISNNFTADNMYRLYQMGIDDMIKKPFQPMEMICRIAKLNELIKKEDRE
ncbi:MULTISPECIES: PleD family two-component system response regulator [unclassified Kaistella]|uniref:response regulator n=1 Tax=unclassified Kaistella TaxID=2762626 RepID=UPI0027358FF6|nr:MULTISPECIES: response regulator [unclassified Kaistella]MCZ2085805.1 response regulator [Flavobacteriales bacterium]MDP2453811.1 response regulator [Kaistella sp. SH11-4b]MDP2456868.1 response regulator [Kaistella sp. SH40-3]MDP2459624.1 response regulator [Kaistella sp. SH19-2b]